MPADQLELVPVEILLGLAKSHALTTDQACRLRDEWAELDADVWSDPCYRSVCEHTRAVLDALIARQ